MAYKDKNKNKSNKKFIYGSVAALILAAAGISVPNLLNEEDQLPADANGGYVVETSAEKNIRFKKEELKEEDLDINLREAPNEGLSRHTYESLEQPAPLTKQKEMLIYKTQFIVSYNLDTRCPNYVCWSLTPDRTKGTVERTDTFIGDPVLTESTRVETSDYYGSGYDRGHMCPAGDNKNDKRAMMESFMMTNICPQAHNLNKGDWNDLEQQCRRWAKNYGPLYICCGPIFDKKHPRTIGKRNEMKISVPDRFFKVILSMGRVPMAIGFIYPNRDTDKDIRDYAVTVDEVEKITGMDFFFQLPDDEEEKLESVCNPASWNL